jgi:hypothetical protein
VGRLDALRSINQDAALKDEVLTQIAEESVLGDRLAGQALGTESISVDAARSLIEDPPNHPVDPAPQGHRPGAWPARAPVRDDDYDLTTLQTETWRARSCFLALRPRGRE